MQPDGMQMSRFWLLAILSEHLITAEPENGLMYLKVYIFKAFYTNLINSHRCDLIRKLWPLHWSRYENMSVFKGLLLRTQLWCEKEIIYWFRKWIHLGTLTLKTFLWSCFSIFTRNCVLGSMFWNSGFIPKLYFQHEKETQACTWQSEQKALDSEFLCDREMWGRKEIWLCLSLGQGMVKVKDCFWSFCFPQNCLKRVILNLTESSYFPELSPEGKSNMSGPGSSSLEFIGP